MPRPHYRGAPAIWTDAYASEVVAPLGARLVALEQRRFSAAPGGVLIVDVVLPDAVIQEIASVVMFAGPVLFRVASHLDAERGYDRVSQERSRFQQMVDSLPDPVVITDASNDVVMQNKRAEHLLFITEDDSPGRRRAVEVNNLLFSSFLSRATIAGTPTGGPRELNLVDPDEGHDLLFEVLTHPLGERVGPEDSVLSVLRDVTDLRRASRELERQVQRVRQAEIEATRRARPPQPHSRKRRRSHSRHRQRREHHPHERRGRAAVSRSVGITPQLSRIPGGAAERYEVHVVHFGLRSDQRTNPSRAHGAHAPALRAWRCRWRWCRARSVTTAGSRWRSSRCCTISRNRRRTSVCTRHSSSSTASWKGAWSPRLPTWPSRTSGSSGNRRSWPRRTSSSPISWPACRTSFGRR